MTDHKYLMFDGKTFRYYRRVPRELRAHPSWAKGKKPEFIKHSFRTSDRRIAEQQYAIYHGLVEMEFEQARRELAQAKLPRRHERLTDDQIVQYVRRAYGYLGVLHSGWNGYGGRRVEPPSPEEAPQWALKHLSEVDNVILGEEAQEQFLQAMADREPSGEYRKVPLDRARAMARGDAEWPATLGDLVKSYLDHPDRQHLDAGARRGYEVACDILLETLRADTKAAKLSRSDLRRVQEVVISLMPYAKRETEFADRPYPEIADTLKKRRAALAEDEEDETIPFLKSEVANKYLRTISRVFEYGVQERMLPFSVAENLTVKSTEAGGRIAFSPEQLRRFFHKEYRLAGINWIPLIGLFQGMRPNEIAQLDVADIVEQDGHWCFDISGSTRFPDGSRRAIRDKRIKTENTGRVVPIHKRLISLGLLDHVNARRASGFQKVFDAAKWGDSYWDSVRAEITEMLDAAGVITENTKFYSFRHTWNTQMVHIQADHLHRRRLGGWSMPKNPGDSIYISWLAIPKLAETLNRLDFDIL